MNLFSWWPNLMCVLQRLILVKGRSQCAWNKKYHFSINIGNDCIQLQINDSRPSNFLNSSLLFFNSLSYLKFRCTTVSLLSLTFLFIGYVWFRMLCAQKIISRFILLCSVHVLTIVSPFITPNFWLYNEW